MLLVHSSSRLELIHLPLHAFNEPLPPLAVWHGAKSGQSRAATATLCCQQNLTRDPRARGGLSPSICIVGESWRPPVVHLVDARAGLSSKQPLFTCIVQEAEADGSGGGASARERGGQSCWAHSEKAPQAPTLGPSRGQITGS